MRTLILGCGYLGRRVAAERQLAAGHEVAALTRSTTRAAELRAAGIVPVVGDVTDAASLAGLPAADVAIYSVGFDRGGGRSRREVVLGGLSNVLAALAGRTRRLVFVSTTGVYGQSAGEWVDEDSPTAPEGESGRLAVEAERLLGMTRFEEGTVILRLSGLYGPGRLLRRVEQLRAGEPIAGDGEAWLNLIHVDDAASAVHAAADRLSASPPLRSHILLVSDDAPVRRRDYYAALAARTGSPPPTFDPSAESRTAGLGKRCRNGRAKPGFGLSLRFPTFETGLADAVARS